MRRRSSSMNEHASSLAHKMTSNALPGDIPMVDLDSALRLKPNIPSVDHFSKCPLAPLQPVRRHDSVLRRLCACRMSIWRQNDAIFTLESSCPLLLNPARAQLRTIEDLVLKGHEVSKMSVHANAGMTNTTTSLCVNSSFDRIPADNREKALSFIQTSRLAACEYEEALEAGLILGCKKSGSCKATFSQLSGAGANRCTLSP